MKQVACQLSEEGNTKLAALGAKFTPLAGYFRLQTLISFRSSNRHLLIENIVDYISFLQSAPFLFSRINLCSILLLVRIAHKSTAHSIFICPESNFFSLFIYCCSQLTFPLPCIAHSQHTQLSSSPLTSE